MTTLVIESPEIVPIETKENEKQEVQPEKEEQEDKSNDIGLNVQVKLINIDQQLDGKIDTGAECCSLGAENIKHTGDTVIFTLNDKTYKMHCTSVNISSADGGSEQRPVVKFNCKINDEVYDDIEFNLNDRSHLDDKLLIGLNLIKKLQCKINPN